MTRVETGGSASVRRLRTGERIALAAVLALLAHLLLYVLLELAVRIEWPHPRSYLGSVTVELEAESTPVIPAPAVQVTKPTPGVVKPAAEPKPSPAPVVVKPATEPKPSAAPVLQQSAPRASTGTTAAGVAAAPSASSPAAAQEAPRPAPQTRSGTEGNANPSAGVDRPPVSVAGAPQGAQAESRALPIEEIPAPYFLAPRASETTARSTEPIPTTTLGGASRGAVGAAVAPAASGGNYVAQVAGGGVAGSTGAVGTAITGGGSGLQVSGALLPLADPDRGYSVRAEELAKRNRGLVHYVAPDLRGLEVASRITVDFTFQVAASGFVMDPRLSRRSPLADIDRALDTALSRWQFSPAPEGTPMVEATVTFTLVPTPRS